MWELKSHCYFTTCDPIQSINQNFLCKVINSQARLFIMFRLAMEKQRSELTVEKFDSHSMPCNKNLAKPKKLEKEQSIKKESIGNKYLQCSRPRLVESLQLQFKSHSTLVVDSIFIRQCLKSTKQKKFESQVFDVCMNLNVYLGGNCVFLGNQ